MTEDEIIADGLVVSQFLASETGQRLKEETGKIIYNEWRVAKTTAERELMWAKSEAYNAIFAVMEQTAEKGVNAEAQRTRRKKIEEQEAVMYGKKK